MDDIVLLPEGCMTNPAWLSAGPSVWSAIASAVGGMRVARRARIDPGLKRQSRMQLLLGDSGWVVVKENGLKYCLDVTRCARHACFRLVLSHVKCGLSRLAAE
jgi:tRNA wybutosine-synthesizing protein 3